MTGAGAAPDGPSHRERGAADPAPSARPRHRGGWYAAAVLGALLVLVPLGLRLWSQGTVHSRPLAGGSLGHPVRAVEIDAGGAELTVAPGPDGRVDYRGTVRAPAGRAAVVRQWRGDTLLLAVRCEGPQLPGLGCAVTVGVTVPAALPLRLAGGSGTAVVSGLRGPVRVAGGSGTVVLRGLAGPVTAEVGSGTLRGVALTSPLAEVRAGSGQALMDFAAPPDRLTGEAGSGTVRIGLPPGTGYRTQCSARSGSCAVAGALTDPGAPRTLRLTAGSGTASAGLGFGEG
ncbi:hypothetical protein [Streptomyces sp. NPDC089919]|uniref:hypothetical protein n=1 Tax=Streptomyces sp. NPDC089919 TaxID=3155188 RepID=UPI00341CEA7A